MIDLSDLPELLSAEDPMQWAQDNLTYINGGETAKIYEHPYRKDVVVRISDYPDGWFAYAERLSQYMEDADYAMRTAIERHGARAIDMVFVETSVSDFYIAICERLTPISHYDEDAQGLIRIATKLLQYNYRPCLEPDDDAALAEHIEELLSHAVSNGVLTEEEVNAICERQPDFLIFMQNIGPEYNDLQPSNWMKRGPYLVLNDPRRAITFDQEQDFKFRWSIEKRQEVSAEPQFAPGF